MNLKNETPICYYSTVMSETLDATKVAKIAFIEKGANKPFVFAVYKNGTIVVWMVKNASEFENMTNDDIETQADVHLDKFPGFIPGTPSSDFNVITENKPMFGDLAKRIYFITYDHNLPYMSCVIDANSKLGAGMAGRNNLEKDAQEKNCIFVGANRTPKVETKE